MDIGEVASFTAIARQNTTEFDATCSAGWDAKEFNDGTDQFMEELRSWLVKLMIAFLNPSPFQMGSHPHRKESA